MVFLSSPSSSSSSSSYSSSSSSSRPTAETGAMWTTGILAHTPTGLHSKAIIHNRYRSSFTVVSKNDMIIMMIEINQNYDDDGRTGATSGPHTGGLAKPAITQGLQKWSLWWVGDHDDDDDKHSHDDEFFCRRYHEKSFWDICLQIIFAKAPPCPDSATAFALTINVLFFSGSHQHHQNITNSQCHGIGSK